MPAKSGRTGIAGPDPIRPAARLASRNACRLFRLVESLGLDAASLNSSSTPVALSTSIAIKRMTFRKGVNLAHVSAAAIALVSKPPRAGNVFSIDVFVLLN